VPLESLVLRVGESEGFTLQGSWRMERSVFGAAPAKFDPIYVFRRGRD
jgi:hypothetical protein